MIAKFTKEAQVKFNIPKEGIILALEIEDNDPHVHYSVRISLKELDDDEIDISDYHLDYLENGNEILNYFLKNKNECYT